MSGRDHHVWCVAGIDHEGTCDYAAARQALALTAPKETTEIRVTKRHAKIIEVALSDYIRALAGEPISQEGIDAFMEAEGLRDMFRAVVRSLSD